MNSQYEHRGVEAVGVGKRIPDDELLDELRRLAGELDKTPTREEMDEYGAFSRGVYRQRYGGWTDAVRAAGFESNHSGRVGITPEKLADDLERVVSELGHVPTRREVDEHGSYSHKTYDNYFGTLNDAIRSIGLDPRRESGISEGDLVNDLLRMSEKLGRTPMTKDLGAYGRYSYPTYRDRFGSWNDALEAAGFEPNLRHTASKEELISELKRVGAETQRKPIQPDITKSSKFSVNNYKKAFGSWGKALEAAGYTPYARIPDDKLVESLHELADELGHAPSVPEIKEHAPYSVNTYKIRLTETPGWMWVDVLEHLGLEIHDPERIRVPLGDDWPEYRDKTLDRDDHTCVVCGDGPDELGQNPDVHHIIPREEYLRDDGTLNETKAHALKNLVTMCRSCHRRWEGIPVRPQKV